MALFTFNKRERLKSKEEINRLFSVGSRIVSHPFIVVWNTYEDTNSAVKLAVSVPKKHISKAVKRNRLKRHMRESYRKHKSVILTAMNGRAECLNLLIIYTASDIMPHSEIEDKISVTLQRLSKQI